MAFISASAQKRWRERNPEKVRKFREDWKKEHPFQTVAHNYKADAKRRGLEFKLSAKEVIGLICQDCYYCLAPPNPRNGIDRVDNSKGYVLHNVVTCCTRCNSAKRAYSQLDFLSWASRIADVARMRADV